MTIIGLLMALVFGFLTLKNFASGRKILGTLTALGALLGLASVWVDYEQATEARAREKAAADPWAKDA